MLLVNEEKSDETRRTAPPYPGHPPVAGLDHDEYILHRRRCGPPQTGSLHGSLSSSQILHIGMPASSPESKTRPDSDVAKLYKALNQE